MIEMNEAIEALSSKMKMFWHLSDAFQFFLANLGDFSICELFPL